MGRSAFPTVFTNACQGEDCETQFSGLACAPVALHADPSDTSRMVARVAKGDSVGVTETDLHIKSPGLVVIKKGFDLVWDNGADGGRYPRGDTLHFTPRDTLYLLRYLELGDWVWWHNGRMEAGSQFWVGPDDALGIALSDSSLGIARSQPTIDTWLHVAGGNGVSGWWKIDSAMSIRSIAAMEHWNDHCP